MSHVTPQLGHNVVAICVVVTLHLWRVLQCVAVCCRVLQCVAVCCSVLQCVAVCCIVLQCVTACYSMFQHVAACCSALHYVAVTHIHHNHMCRSGNAPTTRAATHCNTLQHTATHCTTLQCTAMHCNAPTTRVTWRIQTYDTTQSYMWCVSITCVTWRLHLQHVLQHAVTHCNTLQHTATHCNTLQHTATHCNTLQCTCNACDMAHSTV